MKNPVERLDLPVVIALRMGAYQLRYLGKVPARAAVNESVELVKRADRGDRKCLPQLRAALSSPAGAGRSEWFQETYGNPARWLRDTLAELPDKDNLAITEAAGSQMDRLRTELAGPDPTPL